MITAGCTPISSHKVLGGWLLPNLTSDLHPGFGPLATHYLLTRVGHLESSCPITS